MLQELHERLDERCSPPPLKLKAIGNNRSSATHSHFQNGPALHHLEWNQDFLLHKY